MKSSQPDSTQRCAAGGASSRAICLGAWDGFSAATCASARGRIDTGYVADQPDVEPFGPIDIDALAAEPFHEDTAEANGSSIAFLAEYGGKRVLFSAEAHPTRLLRSIDQLVGPNSTLALDVCKLSHHGSDHNTSPSLLDRLDCRRFLISTIDWPQSKICFRAQKSGKEVVLPLLDAVAEAIIAWLRHRDPRTPHREVLLSTKALHGPLTSVVISKRVQMLMHKAGVHQPGRGAHTLRHSWAIRALGHDQPIKAIADVLGHRYIDTTCIYAKADLKTLRHVAMPWPKRRRVHFAVPSRSAFRRLQKRGPAIRLLRSCATSIVS